MQHPSYEEDIYNPVSLVRIADRIIALLNAEHLEPDAIASCGISGIVVAAVVSAMSDIPLATIRKSSDVCHSYMTVQGPSHNVNTYIIVDDLVSTGETVRHIINNMPGMKCIGLFLYHDLHINDAHDEFPELSVYNVR